MIYKSPEMDIKRFAAEEILTESAKSYAIGDVGEASPEGLMVYKNTVSYDDLK